MTSACDDEPVSSCAFVFICQQGDLEGLSLILATSLKRFLVGTYELIAAIPRPEAVWGVPHPNTLLTLTNLGVRIEYFDNLIPKEKKGNPLTNKIYCFDLKTDMDKLVFLDSDLLCLRPLDYDKIFQAPVSAASTFLATGDNWEAVYQAVGLSMPTERIPTLFSDDLQPPYFNSGVVAIDTHLAPALKATWLDCFDKIDRSGALSHKSYFREQVSLAVAIKKMGLEYNLLDAMHNYWVKFKPIDPDNPPYLLHHTWPHPPVYDQPFLKAVVRSLVSEYPLIKPFVQRCRWKYYLRSQWLVDINKYAHENRKMLETKLGKSVTYAMINGHL